MLPVAIAPLSQCGADASVFRDPIVNFAYGGRADFRGKHNRLYHFLSAPGLSINVKTERGLRVCADESAGEAALVLRGDYISAAWGHNNIACGRAGISRRTSLCGCSGASDRVEHRACIVQEQSLERTEVGYPEFVEQTLQHNAEIVRAMCRVSKPNGTDVAEVLVHAVYRLPQAGLRTGWSRFHAQSGRFLRDFLPIYGLKGGGVP